MTITNERLAEIQDRTNNATPGPWGVGNRTEIALDARQDSPGCFSYTVKLATVIEDDDRQDDVYYLNPRTQPRAVASAEDDALFIAHARQDVEDLLAEVRTLRAQRDRLIALHEYDELIFGGFYCVHCTPDDADDPDDNVYWPCPSLRAVGVDNDEGNTIIRAHRDAIARQAAQEAGAR